MDQRQMINQYLNTLQRYLARLSPAEATEVIQEIESHIFDLIEQHQANGQTADAAAILQGFGEPRQLAAQYVAHLTTGAPPPRGFKAIVQVKKNGVCCFVLQHGGVWFFAFVRLVISGGCQGTHTGCSRCLGYVRGQQPHDCFYV